MIEKLGRLFFGSKSREEIEKDVLEEDENTSKVENRKEADEINPPEQDTHDQNKNNVGERLQNKVKTANKKKYEIEQTLENSPEAANTIKTSWQEDKVQVYFLIYTIILSAGMLYTIFLNNMLLFGVVFGFYSITIIPLLYLYEETHHLTPDKEEAMENYERATRKKEGGDSKNKDEPN